MNNFSARQNAATATAADQEQLTTAFRLGGFKLNGLLLRESDIDLAGMRISKSHARLLGVLMPAKQPLTIPQLCHDMGAARQSVARRVGPMLDDGQ